MPVVYHAKPHSMKWCLECHRNPENELRPLDQITNLGWKPTPEGNQTPEQAQTALGEGLKAAWHINPPDKNCAGCHR
jgi:hypothetical protein